MWRCGYGTEPTGGGLLGDVGPGGDSMDRGAGGCRCAERARVAGDDLLGWAFRSTHKDGEKKNLQIFITPRIIKNPEDINIFTTQKKESSLTSHATSQ